ncbi:MAG: AAA family ATPase [Polyangiales bacterium]
MAALAAPALPIGQSDFRKLRRQGLRYVDKTCFAMQVLDSASETLVYTRPRRFGKTLNLSMLRYFVEQSPEDHTKLFEGLEMWDARHGERYKAHFQRYPVIHLSFRDLKTSTWSECEIKIREKLQTELTRLRRQYPFDALDDSEHARIKQWYLPDTPTIHYHNYLTYLSDWLQRESKQLVIILIDEYDTPLHAAYLHGYYDKAIEFFRALLGGGLKDNEHLFHGVVTGILRVAKEGLFSGLNNVDVFSTLDPESATHFGFTEAEVQQLAHDYGQASKLSGLRAWYNGYRFGGTQCAVIYNPWSILNYLAHPERDFCPHWINTSDNALLQELLTGQQRRLGAELTALMQGQCIEKPLEEYLVLRDMQRRPDVLWSFLFMAGYLRIEGTYNPKQDRHKLTLPNQEVAAIYRQSFLRFLEAGVADTGEQALALCEAIVRGDAVYAEAGLQELFLNILSYQDLTRHSGEAIYQCFVVGLLVALQERYWVRTNREGGFDRYDVLVLPKTPGEPGVVLEFKALKSDAPETVDEALTDGLAQVHQRKYAAELEEAGATPIHALAIACHCKQVWVRGECLSVS